MSGTSAPELVALSSEDAPETMDFPAEEEKVLAYWRQIDAFQTSLKLSKNRKPYTFYDGPPFATGLPHYGHILAGTIKDTVTRYAHQTGHHVSRRFGWDCHGLPVEYEIDKALGISGRQDVFEMGVATYNGHCRGIVARYTKEWEAVVNRLGRWIDFKDDYRTMDANFMESVWWVFKTLYSKNLIYRGYKVMPYSTACSTPLSNFEAGLNYKDVVDPAVVVSFPVKDDPDGASLVAWTTTPWTLPSNLALCVNPDLEYVKVKSVANGKVYIVAKLRLPQLFPVLSSKKFKKGSEDSVYKVIGSVKKGSELVGLHYEPLFDFFATTKSSTSYFRVVSDAYVTADAGTGVVHQAPAFGEDDYRVCLQHGVIAADDAELPCPVDADGRFVDPVSLDGLRGVHVKTADAEIIRLLKDWGRLVVKEAHEHSYPFCWRSDTPLIYRAVPSLFVRVESLKEQLLKNNQLTYWVPAFVKEKRFHNWLADAKDWAISRNRFWGTPIPLWTNADNTKSVAIGSVQDLLDLKARDAKTKQPITELNDLHREFVDDVEIQLPDGTVLRRCDEVFDCWFESGSMPYAQLHFPFEKALDEKTFLEQRFPADFIAEGIDQTRGWFYTLTVLATALYDRPAFRNLIVNGIVLAEDGRKMSKRLKNYPDPKVVIDAHGADALRLYLINSPVVKGDNLRFSRDGVRQVLRDVMLPWFNAFRFFSQQANRWEQQQQQPSSSSSSWTRDAKRAEHSTNVTDLWILQALDDLVAFVHAEMNAYRLYTVVPRLVTFLQDLTNWYVRLNRSRLKGGDGDDEARTALAVLFEVLLTMASVMAPFTPFFAEFLYQKLRPRLPEFRSQGTDANNNNNDAETLGAADSIHYVMLPQPRANNEEADNGAASSEQQTKKKKEHALLAVRGMAVLQKAVELGRRAREEAKITTKTPVRSVTLVTTETEDVAAFATVEPYFLSEVNAWSVDVTTDVDAWCSLSALPKHPDLPRRLGKRYKAAELYVKGDEKKKVAPKLSSTQLRELLRGKIDSLQLDLNDGQDPVTVTLDDLVVKTSFGPRAENARKVAYAAQTTADGSLTVALDTTQDDDLRMQGIARDLVNRVNKLRKKAKLVIGDAVDVFFADEDASPPALATAAALSANAALLAKAKIAPLPLAARPRDAREVASDVAATPFGSNALRVALFRPTPCLSDDARRRAEHERGAPGAQALDWLVAVFGANMMMTTSNATTTNGGPKRLDGVLDGTPFSLRVGVDVFPDATSRATAAA